MKIYRIVTGTGFAWTRSFFSVVEDYEYEQEAIDKIIGVLIEKEDGINIASMEDLNNGDLGEISDDMYITNSNGDEALLHYGVFDMEEITDLSANIFISENDENIFIVLEQLKEEYENYDDGFKNEIAFSDWLEDCCGKNGTLIKLI